MLGGELAVLQAPMFDGLSLDPFALFDDGRRPTEVGVGRCHVGLARLCCTNPERDSSREFSVVAGMHEKTQTHTRDLQD